MLINAVGFHCFEIALEVARTQPQLVKQTNAKGSSALTKFLLLYCNPEVINVGRRRAITAEMLQLYVLLQPETALACYSEEQLKLLVGVPVLLENARIHRTFSQSFSFLQFFTYNCQRFNFDIGAHNAGIVHLLLNSMSVLPSVLENAADSALIYEQICLRPAEFLLLKYQLPLLLELIVNKAQGQSFLRDVVNNKVISVEAASEQIKEQFKDCDE